MADALGRALASSLQRHVSPGGRLAIGLSGGVDSISLLHALTCLRTTGPAFSLSVVHVHHGLSPHADDWAAFCARICHEWAVTFQCMRVTVERGSTDGLEAAARRARHAVFNQLAADWVVLAQHRDDQAETLLFNLLRGTGLAGAAAMRERNGRLLRPLLEVGRDEIVAYARRQGLSWVEDESNVDIRHTRNFLRQKIMPELRGRFPAAAKSFASAAARFAEAEDLLDDLACSDLGGKDDFPVEQTLLAALPEPRARNALRFLLARRQVMIPGEARLREALRQMLAAGIDRHPALHFGAHRLVRRKALIYLEPFSDDAGNCASR